MDAQTAPSDGGVGASKRASGAAASPSPMDPQAGSPGQATSGGTWGMSLTPGADFSMASPTDSTMAVLQAMMAQQAEMAVMLKGMETRTREAEAARAVAEAALVTEHAAMRAQINVFECALESLRGAARDAADSRSTLSTGESQRTPFFAASSTDWGEAAADADAQGITSAQAASRRLTLTVPIAMAGPRPVAAQVVAMIEAVRTFQEQNSGKHPYSLLGKEVMSADAYAYFQDFARSRTPSMPLASSLDALGVLEKWLSEYGPEVWDVLVKFPTYAFSGAQATVTTIDASVKTHFLKVERALRTVRSASFADRAARTGVHAQVACAYAFAKSLPPQVELRVRDVLNMSGTGDRTCPTSLTFESMKQTVLDVVEQMVADAEGNFGKLGELALIFTGSDSSVPFVYRADFDRAKQEVQTLKEQMAELRKQKTPAATGGYAAAAQGATSSPVKGPVANQGTPARVSFAGGGNGGGTQSGGAQGGGGGGPRRS